MTWDQHQQQWPPAGQAQGPSGGAIRPEGEARPFAGVPLGDYLRDAASAVLLLVSLALPWDFTHDATDRIDVVLITIVSLFSLALPYLARVGAFGPSFTVRSAGTARLLANLPYALLFLVYLLLDAAGGGRGEGGIGAAAALGLAGAVLAAQPREAEIGGIGQPHFVDRAWLRVVTGLGALLVLIATVSLLIFLVGAGETVGSAGISYVLALVLSSALTLVLVGWPVLGTVFRDGGWRLVLVAIGGSAVAIYLVAQGGSVHAPSVESVHLLSSALVLWPALAAAAVAPSARRAMRGVLATSVWRDAAVRLLSLTIAVSAMNTVITILAMIESTDRGRFVLLVIFGAMYIVAAIVARSALVNDQPGAQNVVYGVTGALFVLGIVNLIVVGSDRFSVVTGTDLILALVIPGTLAVTMAVPAVQAARASAAPHGVAVAGDGSSWPAPGYPAGGYLARPAAVPSWDAKVPPVPPPPVPLPPSAMPVPPPPPPPPVAAPSEDVVRAMDPGTSVERLAELAARAPETRVHIARNPSTYPALLEWLANLGDPEVSAALRERGR